MQAHALYCGWVGCPLVCSGQASGFFHLNVEQTGRPPLYLRIFMSICHMLRGSNRLMHSTHRPSTSSLGNRHCGRYVALAMAITSVASHLLLVSSDFLYFMYFFTHEGTVTVSFDGAVLYPTTALLGNYYNTVSFTGYSQVRLHTGPAWNLIGRRFAQKDSCGSLHPKRSNAFCLMRRSKVTRQHQSNYLDLSVAISARH